MSELAAVLDDVAERVTPDAAERRRLETVAAALTDRAEAAVADRPVEADVLRVGSTARDTWLAGDRDIDLFVRFPADLDRETLAEYGLDVGHAVLPEGREEYAEHPYVTGTHEGFDVDLVPCYDVESAADIRSAVDRTPFHTAYLADRMDDRLAREVRVFKRFAKGVGVYGSDLRTEGLSGYLSELLVAEYDGVEPSLRAVAAWSPPVRLDPADHGTETFDDALVVIDPTDPERNVAAVCSAENVARLQHHARELLADPRPEPFLPEPAEPMSPATVGTHLDRRGTHAVAVVFAAPDVVDDQLYPQLRRSLAGVRDELERRGFEPLRATALAADGDDADHPLPVEGPPAALLVECAVAELSVVERHAGPPVDVRDHADGFVEAYVDDDAAYGPFLDGDRYVVEREREATTPEAVLRSDALFDVALGTHVASSLAADHAVLVGEEVTRLAEAFGTELRSHFEPSV